MADWYVDTLTNVTRLINHLNSQLGYPNADTKTDTYTTAIRHQTRPGMFMIPITDVGSRAGAFESQGFHASVQDIIDRTTLSERAKFEDEDDLNREGAFPTEPLPRVIDLGP